MFLVQIAEIVLKFFRIKRKKMANREEELQKKLEVCTKLTKNSGQFGAKKGAPKKRGRKKTEGINEMRRYWEF